MEILSELWLHGICKYEPGKVENVSSVLGNEEINPLSSPANVLKARGMEGEIVDRALDPELWEEARRIEEYCCNNGIRIITKAAPEYPELLKNIKTPPRILFTKGMELDLNSGINVAVAGSRTSTEHGRNAARQIGADMAGNGITVISGMAEGIDAEAHKGALEAGGKTVAVLAGSVDTVYPLSNKKMYFEILERGMVISERPPWTKVKPYFYQQRNRIVVGMAHGTVIVEGRCQSGTGITAGLALENQRDIFAVPGNPTLWQSELPNSLIAGGAVIIDRLSKPREFYERTQPDFFGGLSSKTSGQTIDDLKLTSEQKAIIEYIRDRGGIADCESIAMDLGINPGMLSGILVSLAVKKVLGLESGNRYILKWNDFGE